MVSGQWLHDYCQMCDTLGILVREGAKGEAMVLCGYICDWVSNLHAMGSQESL
jgi:hypothetical protein